MAGDERELRVGELSVDDVQVGAADAAGAAPRAAPGRGRARGRAARPARSGRPGASRTIALMSRRQAVRRRSVPGIGSERRGQRGLDRVHTSKCAARPGDVERPADRPGRERRARASSRAAARRASTSAPSAVESTKSTSPRSTTTRSGDSLGRLRSSAAPRRRRCRDRARRRAAPRRRPPWRSTASTGGCRRPIWLPPGHLRPA